jgi:hypothetical protein
MEGAFRHHIVRQRFVSFLLGGKVHVGAALVPPGTDSLV